MEDSDGFITTRSGVVFRLGAAKPDTVEARWYDSIATWEAQSLRTLLRSLEWQVDRLTSRRDYVRTLLALEGDRFDEPVPPRQAAGGSRLEQALQTALTQQRVRQLREHKRSTPVGASVGERRSRPGEMAFEPLGTLKVSEEASLRGA